MVSPPPSAPKLTLTDVIRAAPAGFIARGPFSPDERRVLFKLALCGTGELGYYVLDCPNCGERAYTPKGCRNRHCPSCKPNLALEWIDARQAELLPTHYYQVVFALPPQLRALALENRKHLYGLFMRAVRDTLLTFARDPKWLGAEPALLQVLHTWNSRMGYHVHVHALISAGGYREATDTWIPAKGESFFAPVHAMGEVVRAKFLEGLQALREKDALTYFGEDNEPLVHPGLWKDLIDRCYVEPWLVYAERPKGGPAQVIRYLGQYIQRSALSNHRIVKLTDTHVWVRHYFRDKDLPRDRFGRLGTRPIVQEYTIEAILTEWARHILPRGFHRARMSGLLAHKKRDILKLAQAAAARATDTAVPVPIFNDRPEPRVASPCPHCQAPGLVVSHVEILRPSFCAFLERAPTLPLPRGTGPPALLKRMPK